jgi:hypothetical protein
VSLSIYENQRMAPFFSAAIPRLTAVIVVNAPGHRFRRACSTRLLFIIVRSRPIPVVALL